jgi:hypothetical protein
MISLKLFKYACLLIANATVASAAFAASASSEWLDGPDVQPVVRPRVRASQPADVDAGSHTTQDFGGDEWIDERKSGGNGQGQGQQFAPAQPRRSAPLQGGVTSTVENFGLKGSVGLQGLGKQAAAVLQLEVNPNPPFPAAKSVSPALYKGWLQETHPELKAVANKLAIIEVKGQWDDSGHVLHYFGLPATKVNTNVVNKFDFSHSNVVIVDCAGNLNQDAIEALRSFVWNGGYLVSTDWALDNFVVRAFPGAIEWNGGYSYPDLVDAICVDFGTDYLKGCVPVARWKLDDKCQTVQVVRPEYVHVLVRSRMLSRQDPDGLGILAATFQYGKGQVLHVVGHFDINSSGTFTNSLPDPAPRIGIGLRQAIIANFIVKGLQSRDLDSPKADLEKASPRVKKVNEGKQTDASGESNKDAKPSQSSVPPNQAQSPETQPPDKQLHDAEPPEALPVMER